MDIPLPLRQAIETGNCVLFLGSGIGFHYKDSEGNHAPIGNNLAQELGKYIGLDDVTGYDLKQISQLVEIRKGRKDLEVLLNKIFAEYNPDDKLLWLFNQRWRAIFTTNYDNIIEQSYNMLPSPPQNPRFFSITPDLHNFDSRFEVPVYFLHGRLFGTENKQIIITQDDYSKFREKRNMIYEVLKRDFALNTVLYIGYSNRDTDWQEVLSEISEEFYPNQLPQSYRMTPENNIIENELLEQKNITTINLSYEDFYNFASSQIETETIDYSKYEKIKETIPSDFLSLYEQNIAAVARLFQSWEYINQTSFSEKPNIYGYLRGDRPNWSLIGNNHHFERDIEERVFDSLLDYATESKSKTSISILLAPAGYGITTVLMSLASKLVKVRAGGVFYLKQAGSIREGDIEYIVSNFELKGRNFFFIDNGADSLNELKPLIQRLKESNKSAMFVIGSRLNEWRQCTTRIYGNEFEIEPLSDPEIERLLSCLKEHSELGTLEPLERDIQFSTIKRSYAQELLVTMREATEGKSFDAIIENEYRKIANQLSQNVYSIVCCFYQHGAFVRDGLLEEIIGKTITDIYKETNDSLAGVVVFDCLDEEKGIYVARARHRSIAAIVWERCCESLNRDNIINSSLDKLNINYPIDYRAFESFIRSDRLVDSISDFEGKIKFFEIACTKEPESPYVRQHYARMLLREKQYNLANSQIDVAISMNPQVTVLYHTKGLILAELALSADSQEIGRRFLAQSEDCFRHTIQSRTRDHYGYQGLAKLYREWAEKVANPSESAEYMAKAENIINIGLKTVRVRDSLWIESSNIQKTLGNDPQKIEELNKAVEENPNSIIARYMLGRAYRKSGHPEKTVEILRHVIKNFHEEYRAFVEYSLALLYTGSTYAEAIAVLQLSTLYGLSDARYIATLGGMQFMNGDFTKAQNTFNENTKRRSTFTQQELNTIQFRPPNPLDLSQQMRLEGQVIAVKAQYSIIETPGYPNFLCPGSKYHGLHMEKNMKVSFEIAFTAKGSIAENPQQI